MPGKFHVGHLFRAARLGKGYTQQEVGDVIGVTANAYGKFELGVRDVPSDLVWPLCRILGVSVLDAVKACYQDDASDGCSVGVSFPGTGLSERLPGTGVTAVDRGRTVLFDGNDWQIHVAIAAYAGLDPCSEEAVRMSAPVIDAGKLRQAKAYIRENEGG